MSNLIVVHGASGHLGRDIVDVLLAKGYSASNIVTPVRNLEADSVKSLKVLGVRVVAGDYLDLASLKAAYAGAHTVVFVPSSSMKNSDRTTSADNSTEAARAAGVKRIVAVSFGGDKGTASLNMLSPTYLYLEGVVRHAGIPFLIIRMGLYYENNLSAYKGAVHTGVLALPGPATTRTPYIARKDIATAVAAAVLKFDLVGKVYNLQNNVSYSLEEIAATIGVVSGKTVVFKELSVADYAAALAPFVGPAAPFWAAVTASFLATANNGELPISNDFYELTGETPQTLRAYLTANLK